MPGISTHLFAFAAGLVQAVEEGVAAVRRLSWHSLHIMHGSAVHWSAVIPPRVPTAGSHVFRQYIFKCFEQRCVLLQVLFGTREQLTHDVMPHFQMEGISCPQLVVSRHMHPHRSHGLEVVAIQDRCSLSVVTAARLIDVQRRLMLLHKISDCLYPEATWPPECLSRCHTHGDRIPLGFVSCF